MLLYVTTLHKIIPMSAKTIFSFAKGFWSILGLAPRRIDEIRRTINAGSDADALKSDWYNVGDDIRKSLSTYEKSKKLEVDAGHPQ